MVATAPKENVSMSYVVCVGESLVDFIAQAGIANLGASEFFSRAAGGAVSNVAVGIARLGGTAHFAGTVSRDPFGKYLVSTLAHENVNLDDVRVVDATTTFAFVARGEHGERDFMFVRHPGADSLLELGDVAEGTITRAKALHFGGVLLSSEPARSTCMALAQTARSNGVFVTFDPNARPSLFQTSEEMTRLLLAGCACANLVKLSDEDLTSMQLPPDDPRALLSDATQAVIMTRAERGCAWFLRDGSHGEVRGPRIEPVDTTGAGDACMAAILWRLLWTHDLALNAASTQDAVRYGCAAGALACLREGAIPALPTAAEVEAMVAQGAANEPQK